ncbi:MATE family efflux transporter [Streptomyces sp. NRRL F-525]|uniref:MATE family efflux transporter n=1 Tax=Streptomyces sp. NRRL F-525 TaxID=1463861 RepID=UPI001F22375A|nr:MATE family efflux transporter [Streptomyces sp. NRRL F-525]
MNKKKSAASEGVPDKGRMRRIAGAALPLYLTMIASSAASLVDTAVLGRHATGSLAAFAVTLAVFSPAAAAVSGAMRGVMPFVSAQKDDADGLLPVLRNSMWLGISVGLLGAVAVAAVPVIGRVGGVPGTTLDQLGVFPYLLACAVVMMSIGATATSALVGLGEGRAVMRSGMTGTAAAVVLSLLLVGGVGSFDGLGLPGAGIAMLTSSTINASLAHVQLRRNTVLAGRPLGLGRPRLPEVLRLAGVGIPLAATVLIKFAVLGVLAFSAARAGTDSAAVHSIALSLVNLMFTAAVAVGQATVPLMTEPVRSGDVTEIRRSALAGVGVAVCTVSALAAVLVLARGPVISVFTKDSGLHDQVLDLLPLLLLAVVADAVQAVFGFGLIGIRRTLPSLVAFAVCYGLLALAAVPVGAAGGLHALWLSLAGANLLLVVGQAYFFHARSGSLRATHPVPATA